MTARLWKGDCLVFEAINHDLKEIVVAVGRDGFQEAFVREPDAFPEGWLPGHRVELRVIEKDLPLEAAAEFAWRYSDSQALKPFRVLLGGMPPAASRPTTASA